ncbi:tol-pal system protein YbgF [Desulfocurvibacter africanus PCS]|uniref:Tol-pal system protein YbgF n=2 Tax=Desulfocurvibacter africanus TaxID=873 RepID=M5Q2S4_DESAF|nr:tol-pal system protein YbgF [Desulfocurvibacter africanus PCS]
MRRYSICLLVLLTIFTICVVPTVTATVPPPDGRVTATVNAFRASLASANPSSEASQDRPRFTEGDIVQSLDLPALTTAIESPIVMEMTLAEQPLSPGSVLVAASGTTMVDAGTKGLTPAQKARYDKALALVWDKKPEAARTLLNEFLVDFPTSNLTPNALYWLGETYYSQKRYSLAILTFKDVMRRFPVHSKASDAALKIGYSYEQLGDTQNARLVFKNLLKTYPDSNSAELARTKLKQFEG